MKKVNNIHKILHYIIISKGISRAEISRVFGLNKATVSYIISALENANLITNQEELKATKGRHSVQYEFNKDYSKVISINLRPQFINVFVTDLEGGVIFDEVIKKQVSGEETLVNTLVDIIGNYTAKYPESLGIGIGVHGTVYNDQVIHFTPYNNIYNFDLKLELEKRFGDVDFYIENEANITALGENQDISQENVVTISNSKGIGSGILTNFKMYKGSEGFAGEIGHTIVVPNGLECACGNKGCLEQYSSEENLIAKASEVKKENITVKYFVELYNSGDEEIRELYHNSLDYLSIAINNVMSLLNPSAIVLNGYLYSNIKETEEYLKSKIVSKVYDASLLVISNKQEDSFARGFAHHIVRERFINNDKWLEDIKE